VTDEDEYTEFEANKREMQAREQEAKERAIAATQEKENSVPCPSCGAQIGEQCKGLNPRFGNLSHIARMSLVQRGEPMDIAWRVLKQEDAPPPATPYKQCPECDAELDAGDCSFCGWKRPLEGTTWAGDRDLNALRPLMPGGGPIMSCPKCQSDSVLELPIGSGNLGCISCGLQQYGGKWPTGWSDD